MTLTTLGSGAPASALGGDLAAIMEANRAAARAAITRIHTPTRAVTYERSSEDNEQTGEGTANQRIDNLNLAAGRGVPVVGSYADIDRSAYHLDVVRHDFERLLRDARAGLFDVVIVRHTDRLYRRLQDLLRIVDELTPYAVVWAVYEGDVDLTTAGGIMMAQIKGAVAEHESRLKGERVANHNLARSEAGRMNASHRPFGWSWVYPCDGVPRESGGVCDHNPNRPHAAGDRPVLRSRGGLVLHPIEAPALATAYRMAAEGRSIRSIATWLAAEGFTGPRGGALAPDHVGTMLRSPRHAGLVAHRGKLLTESADGLRVVDVELWQTVQRIFRDPTRRTNPGRPAGTLLSGIARCGKCGGPMNSTYERVVSAGNVTKVPVYICRTHNHLKRRRALVDDLVVGSMALVLRERTAELRSFAAPIEEDDPTAAEVERLRSRLARYDELDRAGEIEPEDYAAAKRHIRTALSEIEDRAARLAGRPALAALLSAPDPARRWLELCSAEDLDPARAIMREAFDRVVVNVPAVRFKPTADDAEIEGGFWSAL